MWEIRDLPTQPRTPNKSSLFRRHRCWVPDSWDSTGFWRVVQWWWPRSVASYTSSTDDSRTCSMCESVINRSNRVYNNSKWKPTNEACKKQPKFPRKNRWTDERAHLANQHVKCLGTGSLPQGHFPQAYFLNAIFPIRHFLRVPLSTGPFFHRTRFTSLFPRAIAS